MHELISDGSLWKPILQHFDGFSRFFCPIPGRAKYLGDVDDVDDVPLIIVATPNEPMVYETVNL
jgi:hypothetical protein